MIYASNEENALLAEVFNEYRDNERNSQSVFLLVHADGMVWEMKSSQEELRRRGYINDSDVVRLDERTGGGCIHRHGNRQEPLLAACRKERTKAIVGFRSLFPHEHHLTISL